MTRTQFSTAFENGFHRTVGLLASKGLTYLEAEEAAQAAWSRGWERQHQLRDEKKVFTWINSIALNICRNEFRRNAKNREMREPADRRPCPSSATAKLDMESLLARCDQLDRSLLWMQQIGGFTTAEISRCHRMKSSTVRVRLMRAKARLRRRSAMICPRP